MTTILIVDDHPLVRLGMIEVIDTHESMKVVAEAGNREEAIAAYTTHRPEVVLMDFRMPGANGAEITAELIKDFPDAKVLIISVYEGEEDVWRALQAGVLGFLTKGADAPVLLEAIEHVARGETYFPARIAKKINIRSERSPLTKRELEVLELLAQGLSNKEMSTVLSVTTDTIKVHLSKVFEKLGVADRTQAVLAAVQRGITHLDD